MKKTFTSLLLCVLVICGFTQTPTVLPRPDFHYNGQVGRTILDSDPTQFPQPAKVEKVVFNIFAEPQFTVMAEGYGQPKFQTFIGFNTQF